MWPTQRHFRVTRAKHPKRLRIQNMGGDINPRQTLGYRQTTLQLGYESPTGVQIGKKTVGTEKLVY